MSKKIIVCNDTAYGYSSSTNTFSQIISGWSSRTPDQKNTLLNSVSESDKKEKCEKKLTNSLS